MSVRTPSYRLHKPTGQAVVTLNGRDVYLGKHNTPDSRAEYDRRIAQWLVNGRTTCSSEDVSLNELMIQYVSHADTYYQKDGIPTSEAGLVRLSFRPLRRLYGETPAASFGPLALKRPGARFIAISSLNGTQGMRLRVPYSGTKAGVEGFVRALAVEWAASNVQVNAIAPGFIRTDLNAALWEIPAMRNWVEDQTPAKRLGEPRDLTGTAIFLASAASDFLTGQVIYVDGGFTAGSPWPLEFPG